MIRYFKARQMPNGETLNRCLVKPFAIYRASRSIAAINKFFANFAAKIQNYFEFCNSR